MNNYFYNDGGRSEAGYKNKAGDCVCRSIAIAAQIPYQEVYDKLSLGNFNQRRTKKSKHLKKSKSASNGIYTKRKWFKEYMRSIGFEWHATMFVGKGCKVHLKPEELPSGRLIVAVSKHYTAVIDGVINDIYDPSRDGNRCVYGYWKSISKEI